MKNLCLFLFLSSLTTAGIAQSSLDDTIHIVVREMPRFPGCEDIPDLARKKRCADEKMLEFIYTNINYPKKARRKKVQGMCIVSFVVEKDGSLGQIKITRDIGYGCGEELARVVQLMNDRDIRWIPGKKDGEAVRVQFNLPVKFALK